MLAEHLAGHYKTIWVPETAREYLHKIGRKYKFEDIVEIAKEQLNLENKQAANARKYLFCDTDFLVTKIWSNFKYSKCDPWIERQVESHRYDLYLLCDIDLPWEDDPLRENPGQRKELFDLYYRELEKLQINFKVISGLGQDRLRNAILAVEEAFEL